jgi:hypothetical protein
MLLICRLADAVLLALGPGRAGLTDCRDLKLNVAPRRVKKSK